MIFSKSIGFILLSILVSSSLYAEGEFPSASDMKPEFPSYFTHSSKQATNTNLKTRTRSTSVKKSQSTSEIKIISISKSKEKLIKKHYKGYDVVFAKKATTTMASDDRIRAVAKKLHASVVFVKAYMKNNKQYYSYYFLQQK